MIVCSCAVIRDSDIAAAVVEIMLGDEALIPTPGVVFRHLSKKMNCCACAPLTVASIYMAMDKIESDARINPFALAEARASLARIEEARARHEARSGSTLSHAARRGRLAS